MAVPQAPTNTACYYRQCCTVKRHVHDRAIAYAAAVWLPNRSALARYAEDSSCSRALVVKSAVRILHRPAVTMDCSTCARACNDAPINVYSRSFRRLSAHTETNNKHGSVQPLSTSLTHSPSSSHLARSSPSHSTFSYWPPVSLVSPSSSSSISHSHVHLPLPSPPCLACCASM